MIRRALSRFRRLPITIRAVIIAAALGVPVTIGGIALDGHFAMRRDMHLRTLDARAKLANELVPAIDTVIRVVARIQADIRAHGDPVEERADSLIATVEALYVARTGLAARLTRLFADSTAQHFNATIASADSLVHDLLLLRVSDRQLTPAATIDAVRRRIVERSFEVVSQSGRVRNELEAER